MLQTPRVSQEVQAREQLKAPVPFDILAGQTTAGTLFTARSDADLLISHLWAANTTGGGLDYTVYFVPPSGVAGTGNVAVFEKALAANTSEVIQVGVNHRLEPGASIQVLCSVNDGINFGGWGYEEVGAYGD